ncbi:MAG: hypothetical protein ACI9EF_003997, partial [Pseudohongiellaceae bacterium]
MKPTHVPQPPLSSVRTFRLFAALAFSFAWVPVMFTAF